MQTIDPDKTIGFQQLNIKYLQKESKKSFCSYCKNKQSSQYSWTFQKQLMHPYTYQILVERGWRRSGKLYYKIDLGRSCCKEWTHRLDVTRYRIKKQHKKNLGHIAEWLLTKNTKKQTKNSKKYNKTQSNQNQNQNKKILTNKTIQQISTKNNKLITELPSKNQQLIYQSIAYFTQIINQNKQQFFKLFSHQLITQLSAFVYIVKKQQIRYFVSDQHAHSDYYSNYINLLFGLNKKLFKKQYHCLDFVHNIQQFSQKMLNIWGKNNGLLIEIQRSGYLLFTEYEGKKMEKREKYQQICKNMEMRQEKDMKDEGKGKQEILSKDKKKNYKQMNYQQNITDKNKKNKNEKNKNDKNKNDNNINKNTTNKNDQTPTNPQQTLPQKSSPQNPQPPQSHPIKCTLTITQSQITFGPLKIKIVPSQFTQQSFQIFDKYSEQIHDTCLEYSSYQSWLCLKVLKFIQVSKQLKGENVYRPSWEEQPSEQNMKPIKGKITKLLGCYHMKYYIGKSLLGVGVVDLLPDGLSSVYFFYDPQYKSHQIGIFSSLIEIEYIRWLSLSFPQFKHYYLGFYIQNNKKMSYKANYKPFDLLCPITYQFVQFTPALRNLITSIENRQITSIQLAQNNNKIADINFITDIGVYITQKVKIKYEKYIITLKELKQLKRDQMIIQLLVLFRNFVLLCGKFLFETFIFQI